MNMTPTDISQGELVFSYDDAAKMAANYKDLLERRKALEAQIDAVETRLHAAALLFEVPFETLVGEKKADSVVPEASPAAMTDSIVQVLKASHRPLTRVEIKERLAKNEVLAKRLERTPNSFYNALKRLIAREHVTQDGDRFSVPAKDKADPV